MAQEHQQRPGYRAGGADAPPQDPAAFAEDHPLTFDQYAGLPFRSFILMHARLVAQEDDGRQVTLSECMDRYLSHQSNRERLTQILGTRREGYNPIRAFYEDINRQLGNPDDIFRQISPEETFAFLKKLQPEFDSTNFIRERFYQYTGDQQPVEADRDHVGEFLYYLRLIGSYGFDLSEGDKHLFRAFVLLHRNINLKHFLFPVAANKPAPPAADADEVTQAAHQRATEQYKQAVAQQEAQWKDLLSKPKTKFKRWKVRIPGQRDTTTFHLSHHEATALYRKLHKPAKAQWIAGLILGAPFILLRAVAGMFLQVPHYVAWVHRFVDYKETKHKAENPQPAAQPQQGGLLGKLKNMGGGKTGMKFKAMKFALLLLTPVVFFAGFLRGLRDAVLLTYYEGVSAAVKSVLEGVKEGKKFYHADDDTTVDSYNEASDLSKTVFSGHAYEPVPDGFEGPARRVPAGAFIGSSIASVGGLLGPKAQTHHRISSLSMFPIWYSKQDARWIFEKELVWQATFLIGLPILFIMSPMMAFGVGSSFVFANSNRLPFAIGIVTVVALLALTFFFPPVGAAMTAFFAHLPLLSGVTAGFHTAFMAVALYAGIIGTYLMQAVGAALVNFTYGVGVALEKLTDVVMPHMPKAWEILKTIGRGFKVAGSAIVRGLKALPGLIVRLFRAIKTKYQTWKQGHKGFRPLAGAHDGEKQGAGREMQELGGLGGDAEEEDALDGVFDAPFAGAEPADDEEEEDSSDLDLDFINGG